MSAERTLAFIHNPQTSKPTPELVQASGYLNNLYFLEVVQGVDTILGAKQALNPQRHISPVTFSLASFNAFEHGLAEYLKPGGLRQTPDYKKWITGHSIGENGALVQAGMIDLKDMAWALMVRELATSHKWRELAQILGNSIGVVNRLEELKDTVLSGLKGMVAVIGISPEEAEKRLNGAKQSLEGVVSVVLANSNSPKQAAFAFISHSLDEAGVVDALAPVLEEARVLSLKVSTANHSPFVRPEERIFDFVLSQHNIKARLRGLPEDTNVRLFSPMARRYLTTAEEVYALLTHQLTWTVEFTQAMAELKARDDIGIVLTADPLNAIPKLVEKNNVSGRQSLNLTSQASIEQGVQVVGDYLRKKSN